MGRSGTQWEKFTISDICEYFGVNNELHTDFGDIQILLRCGKSGDSVELKLRVVPPELVVRTFKKYSGKPNDIQLEKVDNVINELHNLVLQIDDKIRLRLFEKDKPVSYWHYSKELQLVRSAIDGNM